jgi:cytochrome c553
MRILMLLFGLVLLAGCGTIVGAGTGDPAHGKVVFNDEQGMLDKNIPSCISCHSDQVVGLNKPWPNLSNIGNRAANTVPGQSAEDYLRTSIVEPDAYLAGGFQEGIMYREYKTKLSEQEIADLVAYMLTLKSGTD